MNGISEISRMLDIVRGIICMHPQSSPVIFDFSSVAKIIAVRQKVNTIDRYYFMDISNIFLVIFLIIFLVIFFVYFCINIIMSNYE